MWLGGDASGWGGDSTGFCASERLALPPLMEMPGQTWVALTSEPRAHANNRSRLPETHPGFKDDLLQRVPRLVSRAVTGGSAAVPLFSWTPPLAWGQPVLNSRENTASGWAPNSNQPFILPPLAPPGGFSWGPPSRPWDKEEEALRDRASRPSSLCISRVILPPATPALVLCN